MSPPHGSSGALSFAKYGTGSRQYVSSSNATACTAARVSASRVGLQMGGPRASYHHEPLDEPRVDRARDVARGAQLGHEAKPLEWSSSPRQSRARHRPHPGARIPRRRRGSA